MCLVTGLFFKKVWAWLKAYWYIPAMLLYTFVLWIFFRRNASAALDVLEASKESYEKQIAVLKETHDRETEKRDKALKQYEDIVNILEQDYAERHEALSEAKKKKVKELIATFDEDPAGLISMLEEKFGINYVPPEDSSD